jgi:hypothetical protein
MIKFKALIHKQAQLLSMRIGCDMLSMMMRLSKLALIIILISREHVEFIKQKK